MTRSIRAAGPPDRAVLVEMMEEFYAEAGTPFRAKRTAAAGVWPWKRPSKSAAGAACGCFSWKWRGRTTPPGSSTAFSASPTALFG